MSRIRHIAAALCYGIAWLSMFALIAMVTVAEFLQGEAGTGRDPRDAASRLQVVRRTIL